MSEASHEKHLRELLGDDADLLQTLPKAYPAAFEASKLEAPLAAGKQCFVSTVVDDGALRMVVLPVAGGVTALTTLLAHGGYRRRYKRVNAADAAALVVAVQAAYAPA